MTRVINTLCWVATVALMPVALAVVVAFMVAITGE